MKSFGINHIRTSHNPYSKSFLDLCDKHGILVLDELYDKWNDQYVGGGRARYNDIWQTHVKEFVTRDRNHFLLDLVLMLISKWLVQSDVLSI